MCDFTSIIFILSSGQRPNVYGTFGGVLKKEKEMRGRGRLN
jgi:hypothetical protein